MVSDITNSAEATLYTFDVVGLSGTKGNEPISGSLRDLARRFMSLPLEGQRRAFIRLHEAQMDKTVLRRTDILELFGAIAA